MPGLEGVGTARVTLGRDVQRQRHSRGQHENRDGANIREGADAPRNYRCQPRC